MTLRSTIVMELIDQVSSTARGIQSEFASFSQRADLQGLGSRFGDVRDRAGEVLGTAQRLARNVALIGGAAAGAGYGLHRLVGSQADAARSAQELTEIVGGTAQEVDALRLLGDDFNLDNLESSVQRAFRRLSEAQRGEGEAVDVADKLGLNPGDMDGPLDMLDQIAGQLSRVEDRGARLSMARDMFGREGEDIVRALGQGHEEFRERVEEALGRSLSESEQEDLRAYEAATTDLGDAATDLHRTIAVELAPAMTEWAERAREIADEHGDMITEELTGTIQDFASFVMSAASAANRFAQAVGGWGNVLIGVTALISSRLVIAVGALGVSVVQAAWATGAWAASMITTLVPSIGAATTAAWGFTAALLANPVTWVIAGIAAIAAAAWLIYDNWGALTDWWNDFWSDHGETVMAAMDFITDLIANWNPVALIRRGLQALFGAISGFDLSGAGSALVSSISDGISNAWNALTNWITERVKGLLDWMPDWATERLGLDGFGGDDGDELGSPPSAGAPEVAEAPPARDRTPSPDPSPVEQAARQIAAHLRITIDQEGGARIGDFRDRGDIPLDIDVYSGAMGAGG